MGDKAVPSIRVQFLRRRAALGREQLTQWP